MGRNRKRLLSSSILVVAASLAFSSSFAAKPLDLNHQSITALQSLVTHPSFADRGIQFEEFRRTTDFNNTTHVRIQESYMGYPVWGSDAIIHVPGNEAPRSLSAVLALAKARNGSMDGTVFQDINVDLMKTSNATLSAAQAEKAVVTVVREYQQTSGNKNNATNTETKILVFVNDKNEARWAYQVSFDMAPAAERALPAKPVYIIDAQTFEVYAHWDRVKTIEEVTLDAVSGGGFGGNKKMGKIAFDGLTGDLHLKALKMLRDAKESNCFLQNDEVTVKHYKTGKVLQFSCKETDPDHNNIYWDGEFDAVNGGYGPGNDALFGGNVIKDLYQQWYKVDVLTKNGKPMMLNMVVHDPIDNAFWDGNKMTFGDGVKYFYPLTSLGVAAHEVSHGFTEQHSDLNYYSQPGGLNESFSDMAAQAAELFAFGKNSWQIGPEIFKTENEALRYMDKPSKDCAASRKPGDWCSIDDASQYKPGLDVHYSSGVYNHLFYILGTTKGWDAKKAFDVMVHANMSYWTSSSNFVKAACGVLKATKDLKYETDDVKKAFEAVKIDISTC